MHISSGFCSPAQPMHEASIVHEETAITESL
jgi:hypothetical protein